MTSMWKHGTQSSHLRHNEHHREASHVIWNVFLQRISISYTITCMHIFDRVRWPLSQGRITYPTLNCILINKISHYFTRSVCHVWDTNQQRSLKNIHYLKMFRTIYPFNFFQCWLETTIQSANRSCISSSRKIYLCFSSGNEQRPYGGNPPPVKQFRSVGDFYTEE